MHNASDISVRDMFVLVAILAVMLAAIRVGPPLPACAIFLLMILVISRTIVAFVGSPGERTAAIGFVIPIFFYAIVLSILGSSEFSNGFPALLTSQILVSFLATLQDRGVSNCSIEELMSLGHGLIALLMSYCGAVFASAVSQPRRIATDEAPPAIEVVPAKSASKPLGM